MIKLYDFKSSPNCQRVKIVLAEKNLPYEIVPIDLRAKQQKTPDYLKLNPNGKVPVLTDGDTVLYESCIINEYLDEKYPNPPLLPKEAGAKAKARILIDYGKEPNEQDAKVIETSKSQLKALLQRFESELGDKPYLTGEFSLVDADLLPRFTRLEGFGVLPDPTLPRLGKYLERVKGRPAVQAVL